MTNLKQYLPVFGMILAVVLQALYVAVGDNTITAAEALAIAVTLAGAVTTYAVPRLPQYPWLKRAVAGVSAVLAVFMNAVAGEAVTTQTYVLGGIAFLVGLGIVTATDSQVPIYTSRHGQP